MKITAKEAYFAGMTILALSTWIAFGLAKALFVLAFTCLLYALIKGVLEFLD